MSDFGFYGNVLYPILLINRADNLLDRFVQIFRMSPGEPLQNELYTRTRVVRSRYRTQVQSVEVCVAVTVAVTASQETASDN